MTTDTLNANNTDLPCINGIDTQLQFDKTDNQNKKLQSLGFLSFLEDVQTELNASVAVFVEVNGHNVAQLKAAQTDINTLFINHEHYAEFVDLFARTKATIEQWIAEDNPEPLAHQAIVDQIVNLRAFIERRYANTTPEAAALTGKRKVGHYFGAGILFLPIIFAWFTLRKGYSNWVRIAALLWMLVFLYFTIPTANAEVAGEIQGNATSHAQPATSPVAPSLSKAGVE